MYDLHDMCLFVTYMYEQYNVCYVLSLFVIYLSINRWIYLSCLCGCSNAQRRWTVQRPQQRDADKHWSTPRVLVHLTYILRLAYFTSASVCTCHTYTVLLRWRPCGIIRLFLAIRFQAIITYATVGFGDYSPTTRLGRVLGALMMILGVLAFGSLVLQLERK